MGDPTLNVSRKSFGSSGTNVLTFFNVQSENFRTSSNLLNYPLPGVAASGAIIFDILGASKEINIRGRFTTADGSLGAFTNDLDSLIDGGQVSGAIYSPQSISGDIIVYVNDVNWDYVAGEPNTLDYSIVLYQALE